MLYSFNDFSDWTVEDTPISGANKKLWLSKGSDRGIFKFSKDNYKDFWVEKMASNIFNLVELDCMDVSIGNYNGQSGTMCHDFTLKRGSFVEMDDMLTDYPDRKKGCYTLPILREVVSESTFSNIVMMLLVDYIIGNYDRHTRNFGVLSNGDLAPIYDSGSSLSYRLESSHIPSMLCSKKVFHNNVINNPMSRCLNESNVVYSNFELIHVLKTDYTNFYEKEIERLKNIDDLSLTLLLNRFSLIKDKEYLDFIKIAILYRLKILKELI